MEGVDPELQSFLQKSDCRLRYTADGKISLYDIFKFMKITSNENKRVSKYKSSTRNHAIENCSPIERWDPESNQSTIIKNAKETPCADLSHTIKFMGYFLRRGNLEQEDIHNIIARFDLPKHILHDDDLPHTEKEILKQVKNALPWDTVHEFAIGSYRIDMYIPRFKIAVECDEFDHKQYNRIDEECRERFISTQLNCTWVRFDPYDEKFDIFDVIRRILKLSLLI
jgi:very-short-patch-repair endonuclease